MRSNNSCLNSTGPTGEQGIQGLRGLPGEVGPQGERGEVFILSPFQRVASNEQLKF